MSRELSYDVVIVGLGPAGSSLAYFLRNSGLSVAGLDWVDWEKVWGKPCGDAIGKGHFEKTGLPMPEGDALMQVVDGADIYSPSEEVRLRLTKRGGGFMIDRTKYGVALLREASKAGVDIYLKTRASSPIVEDGRVVGVRATSGKGETLVFRSKVVVDATGSGGAIRRKLPREWPVYEPLKDTDSSVAYRKIVELDYDIEEPEYIRLYLNEKIAPGGYWWFFPKGRNVANIGLGIQLGRGFPHPARVYREALQRRPDVGREVRVIAEAGARLPTRRPANTLVWSGFIGVGDNSFTVDPLHGGGMGYAITASKHAAEAIISASGEGDYSARSLWGMNVSYMRTIGAKQAALDILRIFLQSLSNEEVEWGMRSGLARDKDIEVVAGEGEFSANLGVLSKIGILVRMLGRPSLLLSLKTVRDYMAEAKSLYKEYPDSPEKLPAWVDRVERLYTEYKARLGIKW